MRDYKESAPEALTIEAQPEELSDFTRKPHLKPFLTQEALDEILSIEPEVMQVNRIGKLTRNQREGILTDLNAETDGMRLLMTIFLGVSLLLAFIFLSQSLNMIYLVMAAGIMIGSVLAFFYRRQSKKRIDLATRVQHVDGIPELREVGRLDVPSRYFLMMGGEAFKLSPEAYDHLQQYDLPLCRAYFTAWSKELLSLEVRQRYDQDKLKNDMLDDDEKAKNDDLPAEDEPEEMGQKK